MPEADITGAYRSDAGQSRFPRLKLQAFEKARIIIAGKPQMEYVHRLEAPNIVNMAPTYKKIKDRDGNDVMTVDTRFVGGPLCQGDFNVLRERGVDDKGCHACLMARERPDIFRAPQPKYAANILRYGLRPGGGWNDIASPYGVSALVWVFGGKVMDKLIDIRSMGTAYEDIRMVDLLLECDKDQVFQKPYSNGEFLPVAPAVWLSNGETRQYTAQYLAANGAGTEDLIASIGKKVKADWLADDINRVIQRWDVVRAHEARMGGAPQVGQQGFGAESLHQGMNQAQQQYGQVPAGPQGYAPQPGYGVQPPPPALPQQGYSPAGMLGTVPPPPPPQQTQPQGGDYLLAAHQAAANGQNPVVAAYETATGQPMQPEMQSSPWQPPALVPPTTQPSAPTAPPSVPSVPGVGAPSMPTGASPSSPPQGLSGLNEFMAAQTSNPSMGAAESVPFDQLVPSAAPVQPTPTEPPPGGGSWTFAQLAEQGKK